MIQDTSNVIFKFVKNNPKKTQFDTYINDEFNVMGKIEKLFQGYLVSFSTKELFILKKFIQILDFICFPSFIPSFTSDTYEFFFSK